MKEKVMPNKFETKNYILFTEKKIAMSLLHTEEDELVPHFVATTFGSTQMAQHTPACAHKIAISTHCLCST